MRVTVRGAGVIGLSIAWRAMARGIDVTVCDDQPDRAASRVAAGMLAPVAEASFGERDLLRLSLASAARWPAFAAALGEVGYSTVGTLLVGRTGDDMRELARMHALYRDWGLAAEKVDPRELEPALTPRLRGGLLMPDDHQVDPRRVLAALRERVPVHTDEPSEADLTVLATGSWTRGVPIRPVHGEVLRLRGRPSIRHVVRGHVDGRHVYIVPRADGEVVVGATSAERGFTTRVTAEGVRDLLDTAIEVLPELGEYELVEARAGLRPGTPDNAPLIGWLDGTPARRTLVATGHHRHGVLLAPITAEVVVSLLLGEEPDIDIEPFAPGRFA